LLLFFTKKKDKKRACDFRENILDFIDFGQIVIS